MLLARDWFPVPHDLEQAPHLLKALTVQWTGQGPSLQGMAEDKLGHDSPPWAAGRVTVRERVCLPPAPQEREQSPQGVQALTVQSTGHALVLQDVVAFK